MAAADREDFLIILLHPRGSEQIKNRYGQIRITASCIHSHYELKGLCPFPNDAGFKHLTSSGCTLVMGPDPRVVAVRVIGYVGYEADLSYPSLRGPGTCPRTSVLSMIYKVWAPAPHAVHLPPPFSGCNPTVLVVP